MDEGSRVGGREAPDRVLRLWSVFGGAEVGHRRRVRLHVSRRAGVRGVAAPCLRRSERSLASVGGRRHGARPGLVRVGPELDRRLPVVVVAAGLRIVGGHLVVGRIAGPRTVPDDAGVAVAGWIGRTLGRDVQGLQGVGRARAAAALIVRDADVTQRRRRRLELILLAVPETSQTKKKSNNCQFMW